MIEKIVTLFFSYFIGLLLKLYARVYNMDQQKQHLNNDIAHIKLLRNIYVTSLIINVIITDHIDIQKNFTVSSIISLVNIIQ